MINVRWEQHPVGHGGFHTGVMSTFDSPSIQWIFDCGAKRTAKFDAYLRDWLDNNTRPVDWLFISHFDTDHVSGLDTLMAGAVVDNVMVPYLNEHEIILQLLEEAGRGALDRKLVELAVDPAVYFLSRGARRVTFVRGSGPGREDIGGPETPPDKGRGWETRCNPAPRDLKAPRWSPAGVAHESAVQVIESDSDLTVSRGGAGIRFKPYRAPITDASNDGLIDAVEALVGASVKTQGRPGLGDLAYAVANHARTPAGRADLRHLFKTHLGSSNRASLSVLSVPIVDEPMTAHWHVEHASDFDAGSAEPGWLNTGDAELFASADLADWEDCYAIFLDSVRVLALPHHGSDHNSNGALQQLCANATLTAQVKAVGKKHPGANVAMSAGDRLVLVTEQAATSVRMYFYAG